MSFVIGIGATCALAYLIGLTFAVVAMEQNEPNGWFGKAATKLMGYGWIGATWALIIALIIVATK